MLNIVLVLLFELCSFHSSLSSLPISAVVAVVNRIIVCVLVLARVILQVQSQCSRCMQRKQSLMPLPCVCSSAEATAQTRRLRLCIECCSLPLGARSGLLRLWHDAWRAWEP